jgi:hypothetical protein
MTGVLQTARTGSPRPPKAVGATERVPSYGCRPFPRRQTPGRDGRRSSSRIHRTPAGPETRPHQPSSASSQTRSSPAGPQPSTFTGGSTCRVTQRAFHSATDCCASSDVAGRVTAWPLIASWTTQPPCCSAMAYRMGHFRTAVLERRLHVAPTGYRRLGAAGREGHGSPDRATVTAEEQSLLMQVVDDAGDGVGIVRKEVPKNHSARLRRPRRVSDDIADA